MKKSTKKFVFKKVFPIIFIVFFILLGIIRIDMINTKALSPLGNTNENYEIVRDEFGEDFSNFIKDNSFLKIYRESGKDVLVKVGDNNFRISDQSIVISEIENMIKRLKHINLLF